MVMLSRRQALLGGMVTLVSFERPCCAFVGQATGHGCYIPPSDAPAFFGRAGAAEHYQTGNEHIEPNSNDPNLDRALAQSLAKLSRTWDVLPGFAYFREPKEKNALATPLPLLRRTDGTVLFGLGLLDELLKLPNHRDAAIVSVCAHEFGHIVQYKTGLGKKLAPDPDQPFRAEQHADYLAGFYAGLRRLEYPDYPAVVFANTQSRYGTLHRGTHGTYKERGEAVEEGFKAAFEKRLKAADGVIEGFNFAMARSGGEASRHAP